MSAAGREVAQAPVRWGFLGAGWIATTALAPAIHRSRCAVLQTVGARDIDRARSLEPVGSAYDSYRAVIDDPSVEAVYIALANDVHVPWAIEAVRAGKHVLCEKPLGMYAREVEALMRAVDSTGLLAVEASWNRWHPRTARLREIVDSGELGRIRHISAGFTFDGVQPGNYRLDPARGGGAIYDLGPYAMAAPLWLTGFADFTVHRVERVVDPGGADLTTCAWMRAGEVETLCVTAMNIADSEWLVVTGDEGSAWLPGGDAFTSRDATSAIEVVGRDGRRTEHFEPVDPYQLMLDAVSCRIRGGDDWVMPLAESVAFARLFDDLLST